MKIHNQHADNTTITDNDSTITTKIVIENQNIAMLHRSSRQWRAPDRPNV